MFFCKQSAQEKCKPQIIKMFQKGKLIKIVSIKFEKTEIAEFWRVHL